MNVKELREKSDKELNDLLRDLKIERISSERGRKSGESSKRFTQSKRTIAKIKTILREREINNKGFETS